MTNVPARREDTADVPFPKLPPLRQMTRLQKRYFLEPWWTLIWAAGWGSSMVLFGLAIWSPVLTTQWALTAILPFAVGTVAMVAKLFMLEWNSRTEGSVTAKNSNGHPIGCRCYDCR